MMRRLATTKSTGTLCLGLVLAAAPLSLPAQDVFESVRRTDLNDYAFGVATSISTNPFAGAETSTIFYPYLTALQHPAFNKNWFILRDGDVGIRYVTDNEWEFGINARVQTLGLGGTDNEEIIGLLERQWTVESGPMIGWRRFPVNLMAKVLFASQYARLVFDRPLHDGLLREVIDAKGHDGEPSATPRLS